MSKLICDFIHSAAALTLRSVLARLFELTTLRTLVVLIYTLILTSHVFTLQHHQSYYYLLMILHLPSNSERNPNTHVVF